MGGGDRRKDQGAAGSWAREAAGRWGRHLRHSPSGQELVGRSCRRAQQGRQGKTVGFWPGPLGGGGTRDARGKRRGMGVWEPRALKRHLLACGNGGAVFSGAGSPAFPPQALGFSTRAVNSHLTRHVRAKSTQVTYSPFGLRVTTSRALESSPSPAEALGAATPPGTLPATGAARDAGAPHSPHARERARLGVTRGWIWGLLLSLSGPGRQFGPEEELTEE